MVRRYPRRRTRPPASHTRCCCGCSASAASTPRSASRCVFRSPSKSLCMHQRTLSRWRCGAEIWSSDQIHDDTKLRGCFVFATIANMAQRHSEHGLSYPCTRIINARALHCTSHCTPPQQKPSSGHSGYHSSGEFPRAARSPNLLCACRLCPHTVATWHSKTRRLSSPNVCGLARDGQPVLLAKCQTCQRLGDWESCRFIHA